MRDTKKILRYAIYNALSGNVSYNSANVPVYDEKKKVSSTDNIYILLSTQQETSDNTFSAFMNNSSIDLEVYHKTGSEVSKDIMDDVSNTILEVIFPTPSTVGITQPSGFEIMNLEMASSITRTLEVSETQSILRTIIKITAQIIQQS